MTTITLTGLSGETYTFNVCDPTGQWYAVGGIYAFADAEGWPKYIGQTGNFQTRRPGPAHPDWHEASRHGANLVLAMKLSGGEEVRRDAERDLIHRYQPPVNQQHRTGLAGGLFGLGGLGRTLK